ncbi:uncharacterized protein [Drosophila bipectinata]|uniref:uncharacterized protein n=1 Tax=Drosophila bipectinata TaxID=42026 RepID=UPI0038B26636
MSKPKPASTSSAESETMAKGGNADSLFALQKDLHSQLNQLQVNFKKDSTSRKTKPYFQLRLSKLNLISQQFNKNHQEFVSAGYPTHPYFVDNLADQFEEEFITAFCLISTESETLFPTQLPACAEQQATPVPKMLGPGAAVQLPKLPVPNFSGKYTDWPAFHDLFMQLIHQNQALSNIQRFHFLKQALPKEQDQDVHQMELTDGAYTIAWDLIIKRYDNPRLQFMHHMNALYDLPFISRESSSEIKHMLNVTNVCINEFNRLKTNIHSSTQWIVHHLIARLPTTTVQAWEHCLGNSSDIPSFLDLKTFLNNRLVSMNIIENRKCSQPTHNSTINKSTNYPRQNPKQKGSGFYKGSTFHTTTGTSGPISCVHCKGQHILRRCPDFLSKDCFARKRIIDHTKACLNCLSIHHPLSQCGSNKNCLQCGQRHHTLLHFPTTADGHCRAVNSIHFALVQLHNNSTGQTAVIRALIDHGSEGTLITERAAQLLGLPRHQVTAQITGVGDNPKNICRFSTEFSISSCTDPQFHHLVQPAYVLNSITSHLPRSNVNVDTCQHLQGLHLADPTFTRPGRIDALFGVDLIPYLLLPDLRKGASNQPIAQLTQLGWIVFGHSNETRANVVTIRCHQTNLDALVKGFFDLDQISSERTLTAEEQWCEDHFQRTCIRQPNGKYLVRLPLKTEFDKEQVIGKSHQIALNRFHLLERRLNRNDKLKQQYHSTIKEYFVLKQLSKVTTAETRHQMITPRGQQYFSSCTLPHHAVIKEDSTMTKVRVVYDASCTPSNGKSLNDILCIGPPLQNDLGGVIMKWRLHRYVFAADIQRMYRCIDMHQEDAQFQRILWRNDQNEIAEYSLNTVTFGTASAPYTAIRSILKDIWQWRPETSDKTEPALDWDARYPQYFKPDVKNYNIIYQTLNSICITYATHKNFVMWARFEYQNYEKLYIKSGLCKHLYSDGGTNFIGADNSLRIWQKEFRNSIDTDIAPTLTARGIQWHFNPPHSPNFGGLWEANVKAVKTHLYCSFKLTAMTYEELSTVLTQIESCLNSRPLCPLSADPNDLSPLTPGHFLIGGPLLAPPEPSLSDKSINARFVDGQRLLRQFWHRWSADWLSHLQARPKWRQERTNLQIDDLVVIKDDRLPPNEWKMARIIDLHPGEDGLVRVASLKTVSGTYKRSLSKLCPLPISTNPTPKLEEVQ